MSDDTKAALGRATIAETIEFLTEDGYRVEMLLQSDSTWMVRAFKRKTDVKAAANASLLDALREVRRLTGGGAS